MEPQRANLHIHKEKLAMVRPAQSSQQSDSFDSSRFITGQQGRQRASIKQHHKQPQHALILDCTATAEDAQCSPGVHVLDEPHTLSSGTQQPSINPACRGTLAESVSAYPVEQDRQLRGAGLYEGALGDDMCGPVELTWEGVLQAASANDQPRHEPGLPLPSSDSPALPCYTTDALAQLHTEEKQFRVHRLLPL